MGRLASSHILLLFTLFTFISTINCMEAISSLNDAPAFVCTLPMVNCGQGKCRYSNDSSHSVDIPFIGRVGFDCDCNPGWKKLDINITVDLSYPTCVLPDCDVDLGCSPPSPPTPLTPDISPCLWCGEGTCVDDGSGGHKCQCNEGSSNLFNNPKYPCFKSCSLGGNCNNLALPSAPPPSAASGWNCLRNLNAVAMLLLTSIFLSF